MISYHGIPMRSAGAVVSIATKRKWADFRFHGTAFPFRTPSTFLTAAHCVPDLGADRKLIILMPPVLPAPRRYGSAGEVQEVVRHPHADAALLRIDPNTLANEHDIEPFLDFVSHNQLGDSVASIGFPEETRREQVPDVRYFRGYLQRLITFDTMKPYRYSASELSFPCPIGLSGGPVFMNDLPRYVSALVTTNHQVQSGGEQVEEILQNGSVQRTVVKEFVNYGIALLLSGIGSWLNEVIPSPPEPPHDDEVWFTSTTRHTVERPRSRRKPKSG